LRIKKEVEKLEMRIENYEFQSCWFIFAGEDIYQCSDNSSAFQAEIAGASLSAGR